MKESKFTGSAWGLFGWQILISIATMFFLIPAAFVLPKYASFWI